jgi:hypothetical protein
MTPFFLIYSPFQASAILTSPRLGMGGLASALALAKRSFTNIHVYEAASNLGFVGAGIQLAPNMARVLDAFGVWKDIEKEATDIKETSIRRKFIFFQLRLVFNFSSHSLLYGLINCHCPTLILFESDPQNV